MTIQFIPRPQIETVAWDACVAASPNRILYGFSWYLDAVTSLPDWSWSGVVVTGETAGYQSVMPVPMRRKWGRWVVHQPLFCQFLAIYSPTESPDPTPFFRAMQQQFRYGSILHYQQISSDPSLRLQTRPLHTYTLNLSADYDQIARHYSPDRALNLRRAKAANWLIRRSDDLEPLIQLFHENHAADIPNGVASWAYVLLRSLFAELHERRLATLLYALKDDQLQSGALFVREGNRIIYLFNAASDAGRRGNARTLLIDRIIRENVGTPGLLFDFESPEKRSVAQFYQSFGAVSEPFQEVTYNRLTWIERWVQGWLRDL